MSKPTIVMPDLLGRDDAEHGSWDVNEVSLAPGQSWTNVTERKIQVPKGDNALERSIRAHEMMHAKVSPVAEDTRAWLARGLAPMEAFVAAEEFRVNTLCKRAGFDMSHAFDGTEKPGGEYLAENDRWADAVYAAVASGNTGRITEFLKGVRKHKPEWAKTLRVLNDNLVKWINNVPSVKLADTSVHEHAGVAPWGYSYTEAIAVMIEQIANPPAPPADDPHEDEEEQQDAGEAKASPKKPEPPKAEEIKGMKPSDAGSWWDDLRVARLPLTKPAPGGLGRKRKASNIGTSPRRMSRMLTDPDRKVFDTTKKTVGGVVLIDGSASMQFSQDDIKSILEAAPGCTVAVYCSNSNDKVRPNLLVIANKGKMVAEMPERVQGNGVDGPAARWAIEQRQSRKAPVVWITDGLVHGPSQRYKDSQGVECAKLAITNGIIMRPNVETAIVMLKELRKGRKPKRWYPPVWRRSWASAYGKSLRSVRLAGERDRRYH